MSLNYQMVGVGIVEPLLYQLDSLVDVLFDEVFHRANHYVLELP